MLRLKKPPTEQFEILCRRWPSILVEKIKIFINQNLCSVITMPFLSLLVSMKGHFATHWTVIHLLTSRDKHETFLIDGRESDVNISHGRLNSSFSQIFKVVS